MVTRKKMNIKSIYPLLFLLAVCALLSGCTQEDRKNRENTLSYDYPPPLENLSWGMSEEDVLASFGLKDSDIEWTEYEVNDIFGSGGKNTLRQFSLKEPIEFLDETAMAILYFYDRIGLSRIAIVFDDKTERNIEVDIPLKLHEKYESTWGTLTSELDEPLQLKMKEYLLENGTPEDAADFIFEGRKRALVTFEVSTNQNAPNYGSILFTGYLAAMLEHACAD